MSKSFVPGKHCLGGQLWAIQSGETVDPWKGSDNPGDDCSTSEKVGSECCEGTDMGIALASMDSVAGTWPTMGACKFR